MWTAQARSGIAPGQFQQFPVLVGPLPAEGTTLLLPATQTYSDGSVVSWDQPATAGGEEPEDPAPQVVTTAAQSDDDAATATATPSASASPTAVEAGLASDGSAGGGSGSSSSSGSLGVWLGGAGTALGAAALVVALGRRRPVSRDGLVSTARTRAATATSALAAAVLAVGLLLAGAGPAAAHDRLVSTDPADGSTVAGAPSELVLTFDEPAIALGTQVVVTGPDGSVVSQGEPQLVDSTVTQALGGALPAGAYRVLWRVTSADGHPISGELGFTASGAAGTTTGTASPTASASASTSTPTAPATGAATASAVPADTAPASASDGGLPPWLVVLLVAAAGAGVGGVVLALGRARRRP